MSSPRLIVCEQTGRWAAALQRETTGPHIRVVETRSRAECEERLVETPNSLVALEMTAANLDATLGWLADAGRRFPAARAIVLADRGLEPYELLAREAGAIHFTTSPRELAPVADTVR